MTQENDELQEIRRKMLEDLLRRKESLERGGISEVTDKNFYDFISENEIVVIDCWAPWCGPCRMLSPIIEALEKEWRGKVSFGKLNTEENPYISRKFGIMAIPTLLYFKNGKLVDRTTGLMPKNVINERIKSLI